MHDRKQSLGRGLASLLGDSIHQNQEKGEIDLSKIHPSLDQPRKYFNQEELTNLKHSIQEKGLLQPILVRPHPSLEGEYEIIAGERRWRACKELGLSRIFAIVKNINFNETLEIALIENIQREDLNPLEEAEGYKKLMDDFGYTQERLAQILGKSRSHIGNVLRLNTASETIKKHLRDSRISLGHAKILLSYENPDQMLEDILDNNYSVRETEELIKKTKVKTRIKPEKSYDVQVLEEKLIGLLGMKVDIDTRGVGGRMVIYFRNVTELDELITNLDKNNKRNSLSIV